MCSVSTSSVSKILRRLSIQRTRKTALAALVTEKRCGKCGVLKPVSEFSRAGSHVIHCRVMSACKICTRQSGRDWRKRNVERQRKLSRDWARKRRLSHPQYKFSSNLRRRIREVIAAAHAKKSDRLHKLLGCSVVSFMDHLESLFKDGMSWENYGPKGWHIDHKIPCSQFNLTNPKAQKACFHWTNMQPMWHSDNESKCNRLTLESE